MPRIESELITRPPVDDEALVDLTLLDVDEIPDGGGVFWATEVGGTTRHFTGNWVDEHRLEHVFDGEVYVRLVPNGTGLLDAEILLAHDGKLLTGGSWSQLGGGWAEMLLDPVETLMRLHGDLLDGATCKQFAPGDVHA